MYELNFLNELAVPTHFLNELNPFQLIFRTLNSFI